MSEKIENFYDDMNESFKNDTNVFFSEDSVILRKKIDYYSSVIDKLNFQLFIASKKYAEVMRDYRKLVGLPVKEDKNGEAEKVA